MQRNNVFDQERQANDLVRILERYARVMTGYSRVKAMVSHAQNPDLPVIFGTGDAFTFALNAAALSLTSLEDLIVIYGWVNHQIAHMLYTPANMMDSTRINDPKTRWCLEVLEDQRVERLLLGRWPGMTPYIAAAFLSEITGDDPGNPVNIMHLLTRGRTFLDPQLRQAMSDAWHEPEILDDVNRIIDEYVHMDLSVARAHELAIQLSELLFDKGLPAPRTTCKQVSGNQLAKSGDIKQDRQAADEAEQQQQQQQGGQRDQNGEKDGDQQDGEGKDNTEPGKGADNRAQAQAQEKAREIAQEALAESLGNERVQQEMKSRQRAIAQNELPYVMPSRLSQDPHKLSTEPGSDIRRYARRFEEELMLLADQGGAAWERETPSGRVNVQRAMGGRASLDEMFDTWAEEGEGHDLEAVSLIDRSSSMDMSWNTGGKTSPDVIASQCAWILDHGIKSVEGSHTSFTFNNRAKVLYTPTERPTREIRSLQSQGGTNPLDALTQAFGILQSSKRRNKILLMVTDGAWERGGLDQCEEIIQSLRDSGVQTALAYLPDGGSRTTIEEVRHKCEQVALLPDASALPKWAAGVVEAAVEKKNRRS